MNNSNNNIISEGLWASDLKGTILKYMSVDEYKPKISNIKEVIVVGFFCEDQAPGKDLADFLDKSPHDILDAEVSPSPNIEGFYIVFVEIKRTPDFPVTLHKIMNDIERLTEIKPKDFSVKFYHHTDVHPYSIENIRDNVTLEEKPLKEAAKVLTNSLVSDIDLVSDTKIGFRSGLRNFIVEVIDAGYNDLIKENYINGNSVNYNYNSISSALKNALGPNWIVEQLTNGNYIISNSIKMKTIVAKVNG